jgi:two-component system, OmpR family, KDP operon response regulator KdpE
VATVLLVEDDQRIREAVTRTLAGRGHAVRGAPSALDGLRSLTEDPPDVVILDLGLPDLDGSELLKMIRSISTVPVIVATARDDEREIVRLLDAGADDYVTKPFTGDQIEARVRAVLRRADGDGPPREVEVGGLRLDLAGRGARLDGEPLDLTPKEFDLLAFLARRVGEVVRRDEILAEVWRQPLGGGDKTIDVHLSWLRRKLGESAAEPRYLRTVRGVGVMLVDPET